MNRTTPRPWKIEDSTHIVQAVGNAAGVVVCDVENYSRFTQDDVRNAANAELIVRAVNAHDDLVTALAELVATKDLHDQLEVLKPLPAAHEEEYRKRRIAAWDAARNALAKAGAR